jgi:hypothetical protein
MANSRAGDLRVVEMIGASGNALRGLGRVVRRWRCVGHRASTHAFSGSGPTMPACDGIPRGSRKQVSSRADIVRAGGKSAGHVC